MKLKNILAFTIIIIMAFVYATGTFALDNNGVLKTLGPRAKIVGGDCVLIDNSGFPYNFEIASSVSQTAPFGVLRASVTVDVIATCDPSFKSLYPSYSSKISSLLASATSSYNNSFGISFVYIGVSSLTANPANSSDFLNILQSRGLNYSLSGASYTADVSYGFSGVVETDSSGARIAGRAKYNLPYACILDRGTNNIESLQHEIGHTYGLAVSSSQPHCPNQCVMTASGWGNLNKFCASCSNKMKTNANKY